VREHRTRRQRRLHGAGAPTRSDALPRQQRCQLATAGKTGPQRGRGRRGPPGQRLPLPLRCWRCPARRRDALSKQEDGSGCKRGEAEAAQAAAAAASASHARAHNAALGPTPAPVPAAGGDDSVAACGSGWRGLAPSEARCRSPNAAGLGSGAAVCVASGGGPAR
jgi:hypothetical protein